MNDTPQTSLAEMFNYQVFDDVYQQSSTLAQAIIEILTQAIADKGSANMAVSGGSTPKILFDILSNSALDWEKVTVSLVDDRWLPCEHAESNQRLVENHLLQNQAANAHFIPLYQSDMQLPQAVEQLNLKDSYGHQPFDIVLLGMGNDGHTASLFPCSDKLRFGLSTTDRYLMTQPSTAPYLRVSLSADAISRAKHLFLQLRGIDKQQTLQSAVAGSEEMQMPIRRFLTSNITVLWCP